MPIMSNQSWRREHYSDTDENPEDDLDDLDDSAGLTEDGTYNFKAGDKVYWIITGMRTPGILLQRVGFDTFGEPMWDVDLLDDLHPVQVPVSELRFRYDSDEDSIEEPEFAPGDNVSWHGANNSIYLYRGTLVKRYADGKWEVDLNDGLPPIDIEEDRLSHYVMPIFAPGDRVTWCPSHKAHNAVVLKEAQYSIDKWYIDLLDNKTPVLADADDLFLVEETPFLEGDEVTWEIAGFKNQTPLNCVGRISRKSETTPDTWVIRQVNSVLQIIHERELSLTDSEENSVRNRRERRAQRRKKHQEQQRGGLQSRNPDLYGNGLPGIPSKGATHKGKSWNKSWGPCAPSAVRNISMELFGATYHTAETPDSEPDST